MKSTSFKTLVAVCASFIVVTAAALSAHANLREARSTVASLERAATIVRWVVLRERHAGYLLKLSRADVQAVQSEAPDIADQTPAVPAAPAARPARSARPKAAPAAAADARTPAEAPERAEQKERPEAKERIEPTERPDLPAMETFDGSDFRRVRPIVRVGQDYTVRQGETVESVVIIAGSLRIEGRVRGDVVVVPGTVELASTGEVDGDFVNVGGGMTVDAGGSVHGDVVTVGGALMAPSSFSPGGEQVVVGSPEIGERVRAFVPWLTGGLMLGRVVVPGLSWTWLVLGILLFVAIILSLVFEGGVRACAETIARRPVTTFLIGLLVLLLLGPISFLLAVSIVGIAVLPFLLCALLAGWVLGKIAVARWLGASVLRESEEESRAQAVRSVVIGFVLLTLAYMVPVLGLATWIIVSVLGLGAATSSLFKALRRENPTPPPAPAPPPPIEPDSHEAGMPPIAVPAASAFVADTDPAPAPYAPAVAVAAAAPPPSYAPPPDAATAGFLSLPRATFVQRVVAGGLDFLLVLFVFQMMDVRAREMFWFLTLLTAYNAAFWTWRGTTIGGIICQLRVVRTDGRPLVGGDAVVRGLSSVFSLLVLGIGFFWILLGSNVERQAWHDLIAGTVVVRLPRSTPLR